MNQFTPDTTTKFTDGNGRSNQVPAESISQAGGILVIVEREREGKGLGPGYGITHRLTGATLTGQRLTNDIDGLKKKARRFWKALNPVQRKLWQTQANGQILKANTPASAIHELR